MLLVKLDIGSQITQEEIRAIASIISNGDFAKDDLKAQTKTTLHTFPY